MKLNQHKNASSHTHSKNAKNGRPIKILDIVLELV